MSIPTGTEWEIRTTGAVDNGAGFIDTIPGTSVDYSQQDMPELALTDVSSDGTGQNLTSGTGGFTEAMVGNCVYIDGPGFITGWYHIESRTDSNNITVDRNVSASQINGTLNVGGAWLPNDAELIKFFDTNNKKNYNVCHWKTGTYNLGVTLTNPALGNQWSGYKTTRGDIPIGDDRPFIDFGTSVGYMSWTGHFGRSKNMRFRNSAPGLSPSITMTASGLSHVQINCKVERYGGGINVRCMSFSSDYGQAIQGEYICDEGIALYYADLAFVASYCYIHDSNRGAYFTTTGASAACFNHCIFANIVQNGIDMYASSKVINCTFYNIGGIAINQTSLYSHATNCVIHTCGTGIQGDIQNLSDNNIFYNNGDDFDNGIFAGERDRFIDPLMTDPANEDFTLAATSPCFNTGFKLGIEVGLP